MAGFGWSERLGECNKFMAFPQRHNIQWLFSCVYGIRDSGSGPQLFGYPCIFNQIHTYLALDLQTHMSSCLHITLAPGGGQRVPRIILPGP